MIARPREARNAVTRYREAFSWTSSIDEFVRSVVTEAPLRGRVCGSAVG